MTYQDRPAADTATAGAAHLASMTGPLVPWIIWLRKRETDAFAAAEALKATNFGLIMLIAFVAATLVTRYVPFLGFIGRLGQLAILVIAVMSALQAFSSARRGVPASYPLNIEVVKT